MLVVSIGVFSFIFLYSSDQGCMFFMLCHVKIVQPLCRLLENTNGTVVFVYPEFISFCTVIGDSMFLDNVAEAEDVCDYIGWIPYGPPVPGHISNDVSLVYASLCFEDKIAIIFLRLVSRSLFVTMSQVDWLSSSNQVFGMIFCDDCKKFFPWCISLRVPCLSNSAALIVSDFEKSKLHSFVIYNWIPVYGEQYQQLSSISFLIFGFGCIEGIDFVLQSITVNWWVTSFSTSMAS